MGRTGKLSYQNVATLTISSLDLFRCSVSWLMSHKDEQNGLSGFLDLTLYYTQPGGMETSAAPVENEKPGYDWWVERRKLE